MEARWHPGAQGRGGGWCSDGRSPWRWEGASHEATKVVRIQEGRPGPSRPPRLCEGPFPKPAWMVRRKERDSAVPAPKSAPRLFRWVPTGRQPTRIRDARHTLSRWPANSDASKGFPPRRSSRGFITVYHGSRFMTSSCWIAPRAGTARRPTPTRAACPVQAPAVGSGRPARRPGPGSRPGARTSDRPAPR